MFGCFPFPPATGPGAWSARVEFSSATFPTGFVPPTAGIQFYTRQNPDKILHILGWTIHASGLELGVIASSRFTVYLNMASGGGAGALLDIVPSGALMSFAPGGIDIPIYVPGLGFFNGEIICPPFVDGVFARVETPSGAALVNVDDWVGIVNVWGLEV